MTFLVCNNYFDSKNKYQTNWLAKVYIFDGSESKILKTLKMEIISFSLFLFCFKSQHTSTGY
jgi:hypothetical protein